MTNHVIGIDPGPEKSAYVMLCQTPTGWTLECWGISPNPEVLCHPLLHGDRSERVRVAIEAIQPYGKPVGRSVFETAWWAGRFYQFASQSGWSPIMVDRKTIVTWLCGSARAGDAQVRQALLKRFFGREKPPRGFATHCWSALAIALWRANTKILDVKQL